MISINPTLQFEGKITAVAFTDTNSSSKINTLTPVSNLFHARIEPTIRNAGKPITQPHCTVNRAMGKLFLSPD